MASPAANIIYAFKRDANFQNSNNNNNSPNYSKIPNFNNIPNYDNLAEFEDKPTTPIDFESLHPKLYSLFYRNAQPVFEILEPFQLKPKLSELSFWDQMSKGSE